MKQLKENEGIARSLLITMADRLRGASSNRFFTLI